ncbi:Bacterial extracellular solute-binding protein, family 3 [Pseudodesulfovibrio hydrargyri]|uniref:Bacterial extracellular solute-binding protein, family 3 n=1 Tax=Pseudodesulfovibrio hydrargyri TaxID=2125990 RepID=A0A1J5N4Y1_9BACT|nr:transporter substrate-binding domain-containing protein [Pseudodesulfovibrio hydrargyri]OIQ50659.1 Bacterial extracellular solute-binding protein, family 3 [Pseudodesulfovibrio hydrargyri]
MARPLRLLLPCLLLLTVPCLADGLSDSVLLTSGEWPPFYSASLPGGGFANRVIRESFALEGIAADFTFLPWRRALETADHGPAAGSAGWMPMAVREKRFLFSDPVFSSTRVFFHLRDVPFDWRRLEDVRDLRVGITLGSAEEFPFKDAMAGGRGKLDVASSYEAGMKMLIAGRVDVYACNKAVGLFILVNRIGAGADRVVYNPRPIFTETNHLILSRRLPDAEALMARFNKGLRRLRGSGRYDRIRLDYPGLD